MLRELVFRFMPKLAAHMEAESRQWMIRCQRCGHEESVWDRGGIRYKARGRPRRYGTCRKCKQRSWLVLVRKENDGRER